MNELQKYYFVDQGDLIGPFTADELLHYNLTFDSPIVRESDMKSIPLKECKELMELHRANRKKYPAISRGYLENPVAGQSKAGQSKAGQSKAGQSKVPIYSWFRIVLFMLGLMIFMIKLLRSIR